MYQLENRSNEKDDNCENSIPTQDESQPICASRKPSLYVVFASILASVGGILFGYDIGIISGALLLLRDEFHLSAFEQEVLVSAVLIGSFVASFFGGSIVDKYGRKTAIMLSGGLFIIGALFLSFSITYYMLIIGRLIVGVAISISVTSECTYISEIAPANRRGMLVSLNEFGITIGFLLAYLFNYMLISVRNGWQYMFGIAVIPAALQVIGISFMPPSPHYLIIKKEVEKAKVLLKYLRPEINIDEEIKAIGMTIDEKKNQNCTDLLSASDNMRGRMALAMIVVFFQQFSGHANVLAYAPIIFLHFGYCSSSSASLVTIGLGVVKVVATFVTLLTVDKIGRRSHFLIGSFFMAISIIVLGIVTVTTPKIGHAPDCNVPNAANDIQIWSNTTEIYEKEFMLKPNTYTELTEISDSLHKTVSITNLENYTRDNSQHIKEEQKLPSILMKLISVIALMVFVCAYGISFGPVTWLLLSEIFPTTIRGRAISIATSMNWGGNIIISLSFLHFVAAVGVGNAFIFYGTICTVAFIFFIFCLPETKNQSLEEITYELNKGFFKRPNIWC